VAQLARALGLVTLSLAVAVGARADEASLAPALDRLIRSPALRGARVGVVVEELTSGRRLLAYAADAAGRPRIKSC
jgi:D-alanyl-D-alanine carboxypeptidase